MKIEEEIGQLLITLSTTESCTGGLLSSRLTDVSGSSAYIKLNLVTYANEAKMRMLNVNEATLNNFGAVSEECAKEMAEGLARKTGCDVALCTTGIAGPTGGSAEKPVGLCYIACCYKGQTTVKKIIEESGSRCGIIGTTGIYHSPSPPYFLTRLTKRNL